MKPDWMEWLQTRTLLAAFAFEKAPIRFVGGAVRDALLGAHVTDVDAATPLLPAQVIAILEAAKIKVVPTGLAHGTITAVIDGKHFEITTLRKDVATDGRHAEVEFTNDWQQDAARRDFTMNALYLSPEGELFDYFGGEADAKAGRVTFIGDAKARIEEDYLRILRFFRFYASYGKQQPEPAALAACKQAADNIATLSGERVQQEMFKLLASPAHVAALELMQNHGVLNAVCGFAIKDFAPLKTLQEFEHVTLQTRLAMMFLCADISANDAFEKIATRWKISNYMKKTLTQILGNVNALKADSAPAEQKQLLRKLGAEIFAKIVCIRASIDGKAHAKNYDAMLDLAVDWRAPLFPVTGDDLMSAGIAEGKELGEKLRTLEAAWEASDYAMSKEELLKKAI